MSWFKDLVSVFGKGAVKPEAQRSAREALSSLRMCFSVGKALRRAPHYHEFYLE